MPAPPVIPATVCVPLQVFVPLSRGIAAPLVPVLTTDAVPKAVPLVLRQVIALLPLVVQSPLISDAAGVVPSRKIPVPADDELSPPYARVITDPCHVPPVMVPIEVNGNSADVNEHGPNDVPDPHVPIT